MRETYKDIPGSMCDFHAYYREIANWLPDDAKIVEVGVADGHSAIFLAEQLENMGKRYELVMVDSLQYGGPNQLQEVIKNVIRAACTGIRVLPLDSLNASCRFPDNWADFVFIDASHEYELTKADIRLWHKKVKDGGIIAGHDANSPGVGKAIREVLPVFTAVTTEKNFGVWQMTKAAEKILC